MVASADAVLPAPRAQTPKYTVPEGAPVVFHWYAGLAE